MPSTPLAFHTAGHGANKRGVRNSHRILDNTFVILEEHLVGRERRCGCAWRFEVGALGRWSLGRGKEEALHDPREGNFRKSV